MSLDDYRINADVRRHLVRRWLDVDRLDIGTTNGVVYLIGTFEPLVQGNAKRQSRQDTNSLIKLVVVVEKEIRRLRGVREVVFQLSNLKKRRKSWAATGAGPTSGASGAQGPKRKVLARGTQRRVWNLEESGEGENDDGNH